MPAAALTPRVRILVVCDEVIASDTEAGVFTLEGVRQHLLAASFPWPARLGLFLLLSSARKGTYQGKVVIVNESTDRVIRYVKLEARFDEDNEFFALGLQFGDCEFPEPGSYTFQVWFSARDGQEVMKGEHPFHVLSNEV
jgi:hypothetical protein